MNKLNLWKMLSSALLASLALFLWLFPAGAIGGTDIKLKSSDGGAGPDIEISADGAYLAVAYYKQNSAIPGAGAVYLKSASADPNGWVSSTFLGLGSSPQAAFNRSVNNVVYVVWLNSSNTAIQSARCTLNSTTQPTCTTGNSVRTIQTGELNSPDLVVDGSNFLHVAWLNGNIIEMARATVPDSVTAWPSSPRTPGLCAGSKAEAPVLGWTSTGRIHLAFLCGSASVSATSVEYRRSPDGDQFSADVSDSFAIIGYGATADDEAISSDHSRLNNLAMAAGSAQVSLVWDGLLKTSSTNFRLMSITSTDEGSNWPKNGSRWYARYVPSGADAYSSITGENKTSTTLTLPPQEYGLRPSLVISGTAGNAAVVWQQKRGDTCGFGESSSSDIYFADPQTGVISDTLEHTDPIDYSIDPDLVVNSGVRHFVFMKDDHAVDCAGGDKAVYAINYRGPFTAQTNDKGEIGDGRVFLPIIKK